MTEFDDHFVVDSIYSSAIAPGRFESLIRTWDQHLLDAGFAHSALAMLNRAELVGHLTKARDIAGTAAANLEYEAVQTSIDRMQAASFVCDGSLKVVAVNRAARSAFGLSNGMPVSGLPLESQDMDLFCNSVAQVLTARQPRPEVLRIRTRRRDGIVFSLIQPTASHNGERLALVSTTERVWNDRTTEALQKVFQFTPAEINVLQLIMSGMTVDIIAVQTGRSKATIRSQIHSLLAKSGTRSQVELLSMLMVFHGIASEEGLGVAQGTAVPTLNPFETLILPDGRRLDYLRLGAIGGRAFLWLHGSLAQCRLPRDAETWLRDHGLCMVVPIRAGYGFSSPLPTAQDVTAVAALDIVQLCAHLDIASGPVVAHGSGFLLATVLCAHQFHQVSHLFGVGAAFPIESRQDYARLSMWARFFRANARHAPRVVAVLAKGAHAYVKTVGFDRYVERVMLGTTDLAAYRNPQIREAISTGCEIIFSPAVSPYEAFAADMFAVHNEWPLKLETVKPPVTLFHGEADKNCAFEAAMEKCRTHPTWRLVSFPEAGSFVHHVHWRQLLEMVAAAFP